MDVSRRAQTITPTVHFFARRVWRWYIELAAIACCIANQFLLKTSERVQREGSGSRLVPSKLNRIAPHSFFPAHAKSCLTARGIDPMASGPGSAPGSAAELQVVVQATNADDKIDLAHQAPTRSKTFAQSGGLRICFNVSSLGTDLHNVACVYNPSACGAAEVWLPVSCSTKPLA